MENIYVTDMTHFEDIPSGPSHEPARRMAQFFGAIVSAASVWLEKMKQGQGLTSAAKNSIPAEVVERTWQRVASLSPRSAPKLIQRMTREQPVVLAYLLAVNVSGHTAFAHYY